MLLNFSFAIYKLYEKSKTVKNLGARDAVFESYYLHSLVYVCLSINVLNSECEEGCGTGYGSNTYLKIFVFW